MDPAHASLASKKMTSFSSQPVKAVLGPTNTGKTHLAVERLTAHSSGMIGFPLRLLAREVYDRVVQIKGAAQVGLILRLTAQRRGFASVSGPRTCP